MAGKLGVELRPAEPGLADSPGQEPNNPLLFALKESAQFPATDVELRPAEPGLADSPGQEPNNPLLFALKESAQFPATDEVRLRYGRKRDIKDSSLPEWLSSQEFAALVAANTALIRNRQTGKIQPFLLPLIPLILNNPKIAGVEVKTGRALRSSQLRIDASTGLESGGGLDTTDKQSVESLKELNAAELGFVAERAMFDQAARLAERAGASPAQTLKLKGASLWAEAKLQVYRLLQVVPRLNLSPATDLRREQDSGVFISPRVDAFLDKISRSPAVKAFMIAVNLFSSASGQMQTDIEMKSAAQAQSTNPMQEADVRIKSNSHDGGQKNNRQSESKSNRNKQRAAFFGLVTATIINGFNVVAEKNSRLSAFLNWLAGGGGCNPDGSKLENPGEWEVISGPVRQTKDIIPVNDVFARSNLTEDIVSVNGEGIDNLPELNLIAGQAVADSPWLENKPHIIFATNITDVAGNEQSLVFAGLVDTAGVPMTPTPTPPGEEFEPTLFILAQSDGISTLVPPGKGVEAAGAVFLPLGAYLSLIDGNVHYAIKSPLGMTEWRDVFVITGGGDVFLSDPFSGKQVKLDNFDNLPPKMKDFLAVAKVDAMRLILPPELTAIDAELRQQSGYELRAGDEAGSWVMVDLRTGEALPNVEINSGVAEFDFNDGTHQLADLHYFAEDLKAKDNGFWLGNVEFYRDAASGETMTRLAEAPMPELTEAQIESIQTVRTQTDSLWTMILEISNDTNVSPEDRQMMAGFFQSQIAAEQAKGGALDSGYISNRQEAIKIIEQRGDALTQADRDFMTAFLRDEVANIEATEIPRLMTEIFGDKLPQVTLDPARPEIRQSFFTLQKLLKDKYAEVFNNMKVYGEYADPTPIGFEFQESANFSSLNWNDPVTRLSEFRTVLPLAKEKNYFFNHSNEIYSIWVVPPLIRVINKNVSTSAGPRTFDNLEISFIVRDTTKKNYIFTGLADIRAMTPSLDYPFNYSLLDKIRGGIILPTLAVDSEISSVNFDPQLASPALAEFLISEGREANELLESAVQATNRVRRQLMMELPEQLEEIFWGVDSLGKN